MSECKGCGREIIWGQTPIGSMIPLDPRAPIYRILKRDASGTAQIKHVEKDVAEIYVTHFATCPKASEFSRSKKPKTETAEG